MRENTTGWASKRVPSLDVLDYVVRHHNASSIRFTKIDCEGCEFPLLAKWAEASWLGDKRRVELLGGELHHVSARKGSFNASEVSFVLGALRHRGCHVRERTTIVRC